jgi:hypothetical protein
MDPSKTIYEVGRGQGCIQVRGPVRRSNPVTSLELRTQAAIHGIKVTQITVHRNGFMTLMSHIRLVIPQWVWQLNVQRKSEDS